MRQLLAILGAVLIAGAAFDGLCALWAEGKPQVQAAIVGGAFTLLAAIGGVVVVFAQLRRQADNTAKANRHNEVMKLKKEVYEEAAELTQAAMNAVEVLRMAMPSILHAGMELPAFHPKALVGWEPGPAHKALGEARTAVYQLMVFIDRRAIMHPGLYIFRLAFKREFFHVEIHHNGYWHFASYDWQQKTFDADARSVLLGDVGSFYLHTAHLLDYLRDFTVEMQNLLLGELFGHAVEHQEQHRNLVIRLAHHEKLRPHFDDSQEWEYPISTPPPRQSPKA